MFHLASLFFLIALAASQDQTTVPSSGGGGGGGGGGHIIYTDAEAPALPAKKCKPPQVWSTCPSCLETLSCYQLHLFPGLCPPNGPTCYPAQCICPKNEAIRNGVCVPDIECPP